MPRVNVTKTFLPPIAEYEEYLQQIWNSGQLTNQGQMVKRFEAETSDYLGVENFHFVSNGTIALQIALRALDITEGEIITTPFSYVATTSAILWEHCTPVFVDILPDTFCIDPSKIEAAITPNTKAIMPVHVFGLVCDVEAIQTVADKHGLKVIYDAAHAFGVKYQGQSLFSYGDIATCSFHATKLFHTIEGGAVIAKDKAVSDKLELIKRFGHDNDDHLMLGINAKASEMQAAMGLANLKYITDNIAKRRVAYELYDQALNPSLMRPKPSPGSEHNYGYYPVVFKTEDQLNSVLKALSDKEVFPRRYFHPSLNQLSYVPQGQMCPVSEDIASRIMCLPLHSELDPATIRLISEVINETISE